MFALRQPLQHQRRRVIKATVSPCIEVYVYRRLLAFRLSPGAFFQGENEGLIRPACNVAHAHFAGPVGRQESICLGGSRHGRFLPGRGAHQFRMQKAPISGRAAACRPNRYLDLHRKLRRELFKRRNQPEMGH